MYAGRTGVVRAAFCVHRTHFVLEAKGIASWKHVLNKLLINLNVS